MSLVYFFDTETTGLPQFKLPSNDPSQPHLVDLAAEGCATIYFALNAEQPLGVA